MKVSPKVLTLMAALAAGSASAEYTKAGTPIENTATASFEDPSNPTGTPLTSTSNKVVTTVLALPDFDVIFKGDSPTDAGSQNALSTTSKILTGSLSSSATTTFVTAYTVKNDGNADLTVDLAANTAGTTGTQTVSYYKDVNANGSYEAGTDTLLTDTNSDGKVDVTVAWDDPSTNADEGLTQILQVVSIAAGADPAKVYGASPVGTVLGTGSGTGTVENGYATGSVNPEQAKTAGTDLQFTKVQLYSLDNNPKPPSTPTNPVNPDGTSYTPTPLGNVDVPTLVSGNTDTTINTPPVQPVIGYIDGAATPIVPNVAGDIQIAYPRADVDNAPDVVTFTNVISNTGSAPDQVQLFPVDAVKADGTLSTGWTFDAATGTFTFTSGSSVTKVQFLDPSGNVIATPSGALYPAFNLPAGTSAYYQVKVTYPDPDDSAAVSAVTMNIGVDSLYDTDTTPNATSTNVIFTSAAQFGDSTVGLGAVNTPAPVQVVTAYGNYSSAPKTSPDATDGTAVFPMDLVNNGQYNDSFVLSATVPTISGATVKYYDATGLELARNSAGQYVSPVVGAGTEFAVLAVINVPVGTADGDYTVSQTATGYYSTIAMTDGNDIIRVARPGALGVAKFIAQSGAASETVNGVTGGTGYTSTKNGATTAKPGEQIVYKIVAKNTYPMAIRNFVLSDVMPANTKFVSATVTSTTLTTAKVVYKTSAAGTWSLSAPSTLSDVYSVAVDIDGDGSITAADALPSAEELTLNLTVEIK